MISVLSVAFLPTFLHAAFISNGKNNFCSNIREQRKVQIEGGAEIILDVPLRLSDRATCFSPSENLFLISLIESQKALGLNAFWYTEISNANKEKSEHACEILEFGKNRVNKSFEQCVKERYTELMQPYAKKYEHETSAYIQKRNMLGEKLMKQCLTAFYSQLPKLPRTINFPLAYYNKQIHSFPDWYIEEKLDDDAWLQNMRTIQASDIVSKLVGESCPSDMIWWLYMQS